MCQLKFGIALNYKSKNKQLGFDEVVTKLMKYCAYQERSVKEVYIKAKSFGLSETEIEKVEVILTKADFLNEERFCQSFINGKLNIKKWGPYKIKIALKEKGISESLIKEFLEKVPEEKYDCNLNYWLDYRLKRENLNQSNFEKHFRFLLSKGFIYDAIYQKLKIQ